MNVYKPYALTPSFTLKNRLVMAPMTTYSGNEDLTVSDQELAYYKTRSQTVGMVITAAAAVNDSAQAFDRQIAIKSEKYLPGLKQLAAVIKAPGAKAVIQIHHGGRMNNPSSFKDASQIVSASAVKAPRDNVVTPRALTLPEVEQTIDDFVTATRLAIEAGFDGVELHGANTYLLQQFFSPHSNRRDDAYGGSLEKRMHFAETLIDRVHTAIKTHAKQPFILGYRFSPEELEEPGITLDDTLAFLRVLKKKPLDYLHISVGKYNQNPLRKTSPKQPIVTQIQAVLNHAIPLIGVGSIKTLEDVEGAIAAGYDLVAVGTPLLSDSNWAESIKKGRFDKTFKRGDIPDHLFDRLYKNKAIFMERGYHFKT